MASLVKNSKIDNFTRNSQSSQNDSSQRTPRLTQTGSKAPELEQLVQAAFLGRPDQISSLLRKTPELVNRPDDRGRHALIHASMNGHYNVVRLLCQLGSDVNAADQDGVTALIYAAASGCWQSARLLCEKGARIDVCDKDGRNALHYATVMVFPKVITVLLMLKAEINFPDKSGRTALHLAITTKSKATAKILLLFGASLKVKDKSGLTPGKLAKQGGDTDFVRILKESKAERKQSFQKDVVRHQWRDVLSSVFELASMPDLGDPRGHGTPRSDSGFYDQDFLELAMENRGNDSEV